MTDLDPFYPIVDSADWVRRLVPAGTKLIQLRIKDRSAGQVRSEVREALAICARHAAQLVVNDHWQIALEEGATFVHLGQGDLDDADLKAIRGRNVRLGVSTHDHAELDRAMATDPDYVALGPIYPTTLKVMPWAPQGLQRIGEGGAIDDGGRVEDNQVARLPGGDAPAIRKVHGLGRLRGHLAHRLLE